MDPISFTIDGREYKLGRMDAFDELDLVRLILPLVPGMKDTFSAMAANGGFEGGSPVAMLEAFGPLAKAFRDIPKDEVRAIFGACLKAVERRDDFKAWAPMWNANAGSVADRSVGMIEMVKVAFEVLKHKLVPFSAALASK